MSTSPSPGASPVPTSPPSTNTTSPPPPTTNTTSPPPPTTNTTSPPPPSATPTAPPPATPSAPPPATPSPPPPATTTPTPPSTSPPPATTTPTPPSTSPPPPTSGTNSPPPPVTRSSPPPPPSGSFTPSTPTPSPPPPPSSPSSSTNVPTGAIVGIAAGAVAILVILILVCVCGRRKRRRTSNAEYYVPPQGPKGDQYGGPPRQWQHNAPPPSDNVVSVMQKPPPQLPAYAAKPPPPPLFLSSSGGSGSNYSGGENPHRPPSPGIQLGFSKSTFTYEELVRATDGFSDANLLGQGGFGYVHKGILPNGKEVAIKQLKAGSGQGEREFQAEVEIISRVHHRHLVSLVGYCITGHQRLLVYEFVLNNTLEFHLHGKGRPTMDWPTRLKIALGSAKGLAYLHEDCHPKIIHRDIKAANILLDFKFEAKVADFGLAKFSPDVNTHVSTRVMGTFGYLAPEYASSGKLSDKSDVFSFGVMLLELITGRRPVDTTHTFMDDSLVEWARPLLIRALEEHDFDSVVDPRIKDEYDVNEMTRMVACGAACTRHSARHRPKMSQVVRALEGDMSLSDLNEGIKPGHSSAYSFRGSSDYDTAQYKEDMKKFRKMTLGTQELGVSNDYSAPTSDNSLYPSGSSSEGQSRQTTREMELRKMKNHQVYSGSS